MNVNPVSIIALQLSESSDKELHSFINHPLSRLARNSTATKTIS